MSKPEFMPWMVPKPFRRHEMKAYGLAPHDPGIREPLSGVRTHPDVREEVRVPAWALDDERWFRVRARLSNLQAVRPDAIGSARAAAYLHGMPATPDLDALDVAVPPDGGRVRRPGFRTARRKHYDPVRVAGVVLQQASTTLVELAANEDVDELIAMIETLVGHWHGRPAGSLERLTGIVAAKRGFRGRAKLMAALARSREGVRSPRETRLRLLIVNAGLPEPEVASDVMLLGGRTIHPDLVYRQARIVLEYEGDHHRSDPRQFAYDLQRYTDLPMAGWLHLRVTKEMSDAWLLEKLTEMLRLRHAI